MRKTLALVALVSFAAASSARADYIAPCPPPPGAEAVAMSPGHPPRVPAGLAPHIAGMALPGEAFDATDVHDLDDPKSDRRLIFIWRRGSRWLIAFEHGGRGYNDPVQVYDLSPDGADARLVGETVAFPATVCRVARDLVVVKAR